MDTVATLELFASQMHLEPAEDADSRRSIPLTVLPQKQPGQPPAVLPCGQVSDKNPLPPKKNSLGVYHAALPGGKTIPMLKTMLTSACERNCFYCPFRAGRNYRRATLKPEEMAKTFMDMHRAGLVQGMFLSSGIIKGGVTTQDKIIATAEILRQKYNYRGYLHLKIMPGSEQAQVFRTMQLADRVSVNLEGANTERLSRLAPQKIFIEELLQPLKWVEQYRRNEQPRQSWNGRWPSTVTQFVVGAAGESDLEILTTTNYLNKNAGLGRAYFSAFHPISNTPFEELPPENPWREHRLYQSSFLLGQYGFDLEDMPFTQGGNLPLELDPKAAWARVNLSQSPIEINKAGRPELLRIPGIGPKAADAILAARRQGKLRDLQDLQKLGIIPTRAAPFVLLDGRRPPYQLRLWEW